MDTLNTNRLYTKSPNRKFIKSMPFSVNARVAIQLGRESISSSLIAIIELVKNAYDADAETVIIKLIGLDSSDPILIVEDDGNGMDSVAIQSSWLRIGTDNKAIAEYSSKKERTLTGAKGLGRLGLDRLGNSVVLQTTTPAMSDVLELEIDWNKYENTTQAIEEIEHSHYSNTKPISNELGVFPFSPHNKGTRIICHGLKDQWNKDYLVELKKELTLLVSPFTQVSDFKVFLESGLEDEELDGPIQADQLLEGAEWKLRAEITSDFQVKVEMTSAARDRNISHEPKPWNEWIIGLGDKPDCGPLLLELYYFPRRDKNFYSKLNLDTKLIGKFITNNRGVRIYRDGFRVKPYGDPNGQGDWLGLAYKKSLNPAAVKRLGSFRLAYHQVVGAVFISRHLNPKLIDQTNREGIVEEFAFFQMTAFATTAVQLFQMEISKAAIADSEPSPVEEGFEEVSSAVDESKASIDSLAEVIDDLASTPVEGSSSALKYKLKEKLNKVKQDIEKTAQASKKYSSIVDDALEEIQTEKDTYANLASLGILTVSFGHEALSSINLATTAAGNILSAFDDEKLISPTGKASHYRETANILEHRIRFIRLFAQFALGNVQKSKRMKKMINMTQLVGDVLKVFEGFLENKNIKVISPKPDLFFPQFEAYPIDWESILVNLLTNSIWAISMGDSSDRIIQIELKAQHSVMEMRFMDSGCGLEGGDEDLIFKPTYTTKRGPKGDLIGTGMGLAIVKTFVEDHAKGMIKVLAHGKLGGAEFIIQIPIKS